MSSHYPDRALSAKPRCLSHPAAAATIARGSLVGLAILMGGCAPNRSLSLDEPIGPLSWRPDESRGSLVVYSDEDSAPPNEPFDGRRTDYWLYTGAGKLMQMVNNRASVFSQDPATLDLPVGQYRVTARAARYGWVTIPVVIQGGRRTVVDLDQEVLSNAKPANGDWVRLPDGAVIGSKPE